MSTTLTHPEWNQETGGLQVAEAFASQIKGKKILITGVSPESIGSSIAQSIASQSPSLLILASRTQSKLTTVMQTIKTAYPTTPTTIKPVLLDLMSQESIKLAAQDVMDITPTLDIIINNAAAMTPTKTLTKEGIEAQFGSSHIGHFLFTNLLIPLLLSSTTPSTTPGSTRIINLTSLGHRLSPIRFHDYNFDGNEIPDEEKYPGGKMPKIFENAEGTTYNGYIAYGQAKSANVLFSVGVNQRLGYRGVRSYAVHPGSIWTGLSRNLDPEGQETIRKTSPFWKNHDQGAATILVAAFDPALNEQKGILLHDCQLTDAAPHASDPKIAERLWALSEKLVKREFKL